MFLSTKADSGDRSVWGDFWFSPVPFAGGAANVTGDVAMQLTAVYACVRNAAEDTSTLPFMLRKVNPDGTKKLITNHWLYRLIAKRPNDFQTPMEFREMMQGHLELRGNAFAEIYSNSKGEVTDLVPLPPDSVTVEMLSDTNWRYLVRRSDGSQYRIARPNMFHLKGLSFNGVVGCNPIQIARKAISAGIAAQDYGCRFFENDAKPGGWIEYPGNFKDDESRRKWRESWQTQQGGSNKHKTAVLEFGMKYHELAVSNDDAQFIETKKYVVADIARMWRMPPHIIGDLDRSTNNNIEQQSLEYVIYSIRPRLVRWEEALKSAFLDVDDDSIEIEFSVLALLRGDSVSRAQYINTRIMNGSMTRNEGRSMEGDNPLPGLDEPLRPLNMVEENAAEKEDSEEESGSALPNNAIPNTPQKSDARLLTLSVAAADRIARKEWQMIEAALRSHDKPEAIRQAYEKHAGFVSGCLGVSSEIAKSYCESRINDLAENSSHEDFAAMALSRLERIALTGKL